MAIQPISGKYGRIRYAQASGTAVDLIADNWDAAINVEATDTTNFGTFGWHDNIAGIYKADYTLSGPIVKDPSSGVMDTLPTEGDIVLVEVSSDSTRANPPAAGLLYRDEILVTSVKKTLTVKGKYEFEISGTTTVSSNTYTMATT